MTRPIEEVHQVLELRSEGLGARRIARRTDLPLATVQKWIHNPRGALERGNRGGRGKACHGRCKPWVQVDEPVYAYLLGIYLGDGHIVEEPRTYRLSIYCDPKYPQIMDEVEAAIAAVRQHPTVGRRRHTGCIDVNAYWQHWPCVFPQHGPGVKHERKIELVDWQLEIGERYPRPLLRGLIQSDGWRGKNVAIRHTELAIEYRTYTRYQFCNHSDDILKIFCGACDAIDVHWTQANRWTISVARREDVFHLDSFIGPKR